MSLPALAALVERAEALIAALDGDDPARIQAASTEMRGAMSQLSASASWELGPPLRERLGEALRLTEAAGGRVNYLADRNHRRLDRLATLAGAPRAIAYGRGGRLG